MATDTTARPKVLYRETQFFAPWFGAIPLGVVLLSAALAVSLPAPANAVGWVTVGWTTALSAFLLATLGRMTTQLSATELRVRFGWLPVFRVTVPLHRIQGFEATTYRPIRSYGGWGMRGTALSGGALNARGNRGVALLLDNGKTLMIGSQTPEDLARAMGQVLAPEPQENVRVPRVG